MAKKIQMWRKLGPQLSPKSPLEAVDLVEELVAATNQTRGSINAVLNEMDDVTLRNLRQGRIVKFPNGMSFRPVGNKDGQIKVRVWLSRSVVKRVNEDFRGEWLNAENFGKSEEEMIALWNELYPDDLIDDAGG